jgi:hypothetical protein
MANVIKRVSFLAGPPHGGPIEREENGIISSEKIITRQGVHAGWRIHLHYQRDGSFP